VKRAYLKSDSAFVEVGYDVATGCLCVAFVKDSLGKDRKIVPLGDFTLADFLVDERVPLEVLEEAISRAQGIDEYPEGVFDDLPGDHPARQADIKDLSSPNGADPVAGPGPDPEEDPPNQENVEVI